MSESLYQGQETLPDHPIVLNKFPFEPSSSQHSLTLKALTSLRNYSTASKDINGCQTFQHIECVKECNITVYDLLRTLHLSKSSYVPE